ncbi:MAG: hypothetical protein FJX76_17965 [Armatimonadetes bacterium]|nr:hypothetical protein [Armatimonadota bacterium]
MPNPVTFLSHLQEHGYHPRSDKHSNALCEAIVHDLLDWCPRLREDAATGRLVYDLNFTIRPGTAEWNSDLVLGHAQLGTRPPDPALGIHHAPPSTVLIAIEIKAVMTEHRKNVKNRKRDFEAHHEHVHNYNQQAVAGGVLIVNAADRFASPLRLGGEATVHGNPTALVEHCIGQLRAVSSRGGATGYGLEAKCALVVSHDNIDNARSSYWTRPPAPAIGDPLHYDAFIQSISTQYTQRF